MWPLIVKDMMQNAKALLLFYISALSLPTAFYLIKSPQSDSSGFVGVTFSYVVFGAPILFAVWFIGQEKVKGTFRFLKILPISGMRVILAKSLTSLCLCLILMNFILLVIPLLLRISGIPMSISAPRMVLWLNLATIFFISLNTLVFTALDHKIATQISIFCMMAVGLGAAIAGKLLAPLLAPHGYGFGKLTGLFKNEPGILYFIGFLILIFSAAMIRLAGRILERAEWPDLEES